MTGSIFIDRKNIGNDLKISGGGAQVARTGRKVPAKRSGGGGSADAATPLGQACGGARQGGARGICAAVQQRCSAVEQRAMLLSVTCACRERQRVQKREHGTAPRQRLARLPGARATINKGSADTQKTAKRDNLKMPARASPLSAFATSAPSAFAPAPPWAGRPWVAPPWVPSGCIRASSSLRASIGPSPKGRGASAEMASQQHERDIFSISFRSYEWALWATMERA